jgi:hypothetical protein
VPDYVLSTGVTYYARVTATLGDNSAQSDVSSFTVAPVDYTDAPVFVNPAASGQTIHSNESVTLAPYGGLSAIIVEISKTDAFPTRTGTYRVTLNNFETSTKELGEVLISSSHLEDGTTYYLRARGNYLKSNSNYYTPYTDVMTFVYSSAAGIDAIGTDADARTVIGYYDLQGRPVDTTIAGSLYIARYSDGTAAKVIAK